MTLLLGNISQLLGDAADISHVIAIQPSSIVNFGARGFLGIDLHSRDLIVGRPYEAVSKLLSARDCDHGARRKLCSA
jgi:hypothetical protein